MKKSSLLGSVFLICATFQLLIHKSASAQTWVTTTDTIISLTGIDTITYQPVFSRFKFSTPDAPILYDTLNIKIYYYLTSNSAVGFQVTEHQYAKFDSTQSDTLGFIVSSLAGSTNSIVTNSQSLGISNGFKGMEIGLKYNDLVDGKIVLSFTRFYFLKDLLLTFTVTGFQNDIAQLNSDKNLFFNSISFL